MLVSLRAAGYGHDQDTDTDTVPKKLPTMPLERKSKSKSKSSSSPASAWPKFDPQEGFALNEAARQICVDRWRKPAQGAGAGAGGGGVLTTRVDYAVLSDATERFSEEKGKGYLMGKGASCRVFRAKVYGYPCAIKMFNETAGSWVSAQAHE